MRKVMYNDIKKDIEEVLQNRFGKHYYVGIEVADISLRTDGYDTLYLRIAVPGLGMSSFGILVDGEDDEPVKVYPKKKATTPEECGYRQRWNK